MGAYGPPEHEKRFFFFFDQPPLASIFDDFRKSCFFWKFSKLFSGTSTGPIVTKFSACVPIMAVNYTNNNERSRLENVASSISEEKKRKNENRKYWKTP
jgi:hypothetical protein